VNKKIRILLVDDHILVRMGLVSATKVVDDMEVVAEAEDGDDARRACREHQPDVAVLDLRLPVADGFDLINQLRQDCATVRVLVLSNYGDGQDIARAMQAGASGYVIKGMTLDVLLEAIRSVYQGVNYIPTEIGSRLAGRIQSQLSDRELEVLRLIAKGRSNKEIGADLGIAEATVKVHVGNIIVKLGVADRTQAVVQGLKRHLVRLE
jgi:DNA-binding NarL/FixJ family response regulator